MPNEAGHTLLYPGLCSNSGYDFYDFPNWIQYNSRKIALWKKKSVKNCI